MKGACKEASIWAIIAVFLLPIVAGAASPNDVRSNAILWLERNQNADGSWGARPTRAVTTAEALLALAKSGRTSGTAEQRAIGWLGGQEFASVDFGARRVRALAEAGVDMSREAQALNGAAPYSTGWGPVSTADVTSYDTALALGAIAAAGVAVGGEAVRKQEVLSRRRDDDGWAGDGIADSATSGASDLTATAEIVRALAGVATPGELAPSLAFLEAGAVDSSSDTLELAARLAALHATGATNAAISGELCDDARLTNGVWADTGTPADGFINAMGLLAITTTPGSSFVDPPFDPDADLDGKRDAVDEDRDGDGFCDPGESGECVGEDLFPDDPSEHADSDGDGVGDSAEFDDDNDGIEDSAELAAGTDPTNNDTDGDGVLDGADDCPLIAYQDLGGGVFEGVDADGDGVCTPLDECDGQADPFDIHDLDGDQVCDGADDDDDGDGWNDSVELAWGADPRDAGSVPDDIASLDPDGDFDGDGLLNADEDATYLTSPYLADSDSDGAPDAIEVLSAAATDPNDASSQPPAVLAVFSAVSGSEPTGPGDPFEPELGDVGGLLRATVTGGQVTPVARPGAPQLLSAAAGSPGAVSLAGFQPQTTRARDLDGDGLSGDAEALRRTSQTDPDTDGDGFADGAGGQVEVAQLPSGWDLDGDGFVDGEEDLGTDPADFADRAGKPGDVAPWGFPDGKIQVGDAVVELRIVADPSLTESLAPDNEALTKLAADVNENGQVNSGDALNLLQMVGSGEEP